MSAGPVFVITGTSGAGKGTLVRELLQRVTELELAVSATTREQRPGEENGREYWFLSQEEFAERLERGEFLEHIDFPWGQRSGTLWSELERISAAGRAPLLELETFGALVVRDEVPGSVTIFVKAPTFDELERRLRARDGERRRDRRAPRPRPAAAGAEGRVSARRRQRRPRARDRRARRDRPSAPSDSYDAGP